MNEKKLDAVIIAPGDRKQIYQSLGTAGISALETPVWAGLFATFLRIKGFSVRIIDQNAEYLSPEATAERVKDMNPHLAILTCYGHQPSASTQVMPAAGAIATAIKQLLPEQKIIMAGGHVASLPERTLKEESVDFVCTGEGPYTLLDLLRAIKSGETDYRSVRGVLYRRDEEFIQTPYAPLVLDLDNEMPGMAYDLMPMHLYRAHNWHCFGHINQRQPYASMYTTLGCPYHCSFCCIQAPFKTGEAALGWKAKINSYRKWSPQTVIGWFDTLVNDYGVYNIKIADEMFQFGNERHDLAICKLLIERGHRVNIWSYGRADTLTKDDAIALEKEAGVNWGCIGFESASERVRGDVDKGFEQELLYTTVEKMKRHGMYILANFIFGLPEDDFETMQQTLDYAMELKPEWANFYCAMAYPGSALYTIAIKNGWPLPKTWSGYSQHSKDTLCLPTNYLTGPEVLKFKDEARVTFNENPEWQKMILQKFGQETYEHVLALSQIRLERDNVK